MKKLWIFGFFSRTHLRDTCLGVSIVVTFAIFTLAFSFNAIAQDEGEKSDEFTLEEITVTGSRIKGVEGVGTSVIRLDREEIEISGNFTIDKVIKELPSIMDLGVTELHELKAAGQ